MAPTAFVGVSAHLDFTHDTTRACLSMQEMLDVERCKAVFPYGLPIVEVRSLGALDQQCQGQHWMQLLATVLQVLLPCFCCCS